MLEWKSPLSSWEFLKFWKQVWPVIWSSALEADGPFAKTTFPSRANWFKALQLTPFDKVKVVILGQDPYHTKGLADGLAFSVPPHIRKLPPSLLNLFKEYQADLGYQKPRTGDLSEWAVRGVLLLNTVLTVEEGKANSHKGLGWEKLTYEVLRSLAKRGEVVFLLMGRQAQEYRAACHPCPVVCTPHPSPLAKGFLGSKPFSRVNELLKEKIDWRLQ